MKLNYLETFRGCMALWVVIFHGLGFLPVFSNIVFFEFLNSGILPVMGFIMLSGFVTHILLEKKESYLTYLRRRAFRLFPVYIFTFIISLIMLPFAKGVLQSLPFENHKIQTRIELVDAAFNNHFFMNIVSHLGLVHGLFPNDKYPFTYTIMGQSWSLTLEWQFYIFIPVIFGLLYLKKNRIRNLMMTVVFIISIPFAYYFMRQDSFLPCMIHYFLIGFFSCFFYRKYRETNNKSLFVFLLLTAVALFLIDWRHAVIILLFGSILFLQKNRYLSRIFENRYLLHLGKISYSVYCNHMIVYFILLFFLQKMNIKNDYIFSIITLTIGSIVTIILSNYTYRFIEARFINYAKKG